MNANKNNNASQPDASTIPDERPERKTSRRSRFPDALDVPLLIGGVLAVLYFVATSEELAGRRLAKLVAYRLDCRYWPNWYSVLLWLGAMGTTSVLLVQSAFFSRFLSRILPRQKKLPPGKLALFAALFYLLLIFGVMLWLFVDFKSLWRIMRFKLFADYFQNPVVLLAEEGRFSVRLLTGPLLIGAALLLLWLRKKKGHKVMLVLLLLFPFPSLLMARPNEYGDAPKKIRLLQEAEYRLEQDVQKVAESPSVKNFDGGYNVDPAILSCFAVMGYSYTGGRYHNEEIKFRMRFPPKVEPGVKYPLIVWFHGYGESTGDNERHLAHLHRAIASFAGKDALDFFMIAVQCPADAADWETSVSSEGKGDSRLTIVNEIMNAVLQEYPIDDARVGVVGISSGGVASWRFVERNSGRIAGLVSFSGTPPAGLSPEAFVPTSIWAFNNKGDAQTSWEKTRDLVDAINALGGNAYVTLKDYGVHDSWSEPLKSKDVVKWLVSQSLDGKGLLQDVPYPARSGTRVFLMFVLPIVLMTASLFLLIRRRKDQA